MKILEKFDYEAVRNDITAMWALKKTDLDSIYSSSEKLGTYDTFDGLEWGLIENLGLAYDAKLIWGEFKKCGHGYSHKYFKGVFDDRNNSKRN